MWKFIAAGLYRKERKSVMRVVPLSIFLFVVGLLFGYFVPFPIGLQFLLDFGDPEILQASISVSRYFSLFALLIIVMGFIFQTPLIMVVTTSVGLTTPEFFSGKRKYFIVGAFILAALLTPPDWITQTLLAGPLVVLFEVGIVLCRSLVPGKGKKARVSEEAPRAGNAEVKAEAKAGADAAGKTGPAPGDGERPRPPVSGERKEDEASPPPAG